ncbi:MULTISPECIES: ParA family protein [unclassified Meiothermus]|uniref:ParA family protein n=1 Tax=unclassified Meiothermus TaxID=370471 RepID=UPI000D7CAA23|nr:MULTISPECIES: ParA family protein [unclassified Meiothermus]PZA05878.1 ParA family protein [Meiothermus sp. Pnk-1]RYM29419.1 ParA family protein [Meiothermus sp. PNK-Is4]
MKRIGVVNQKGGVGKTTTAVNLAAYLSQAGQRVLLVDLDPQANATSGLGQETHNGGIYALLTGEANLEQVVQAVNPRLHLIGAESSLVGASADLLEDPSRLRRVLEPLTGEYDLIVLDAPPSLGPLTLNVLAAAQGLLIPVQAEYYALEGIAGLMETVEQVRVRLNPGLRILGIVITMYDSRTLLSQQVEANIRAHFGEQVFWTVVPRNVRLAEAPSYGQAISTYAPTSSGAHAYRRLAEEVMRRVQEA